MIESFFKHILKEVETDRVSNRLLHKKEPIESLSKHILTEERVDWVILQTHSQRRENEMMFLLQLLAECQCYELHNQDWNNVRFDCLSELPMFARLSK